MKTHIFATSAFAVLLAATLFCSSAGAQTDIFVRVSGISGGSTDDKHKDWIDATAVLEILKGGSSALTGGGKSSDRALVESFTITKKLDESSPLLKLNLMQGKHIPEVLIEYCKADKNKTKFYTITLKDVVITSMRSKVEQDLLMEEVSFDFGSIEWSYIPVDNTGKPGGTVNSGWDLKTNKKL